MEPPTSALTAGAARVEITPPLSIPYLGYAPRQAFFHGVHDPLFARAVVVNSGNANACTGKQGLKDAEAMTELTAEALGLRSEEVLVCSTGRIGVLMRLPVIRTNGYAVRRGPDCFMYGKKFRIESTP